jgi:beta-carotene 3-hydroxylase
VADRRARRAREQSSYQVAALAATTLIGALAVGATYVRFARHLDLGDPFPWLELASTLFLVFGGIVGMEMYARWAHRHVWHDMAAGWALHKSHHEPRTGPFEANDIYALANAVPATALCLYGFLRPDMIGGLCFGAGLGITLFGISYM